MAKKIELIIYSCSQCPHSQWDYDYGRYRCWQNGDPVIIKDYFGLPEDCKLEEV